MRPKKTVPAPPPLVRQDAAMDTTPDDELSKLPTPPIYSPVHYPDTTPSDEDQAVAIPITVDKKKTRNYDEWYAHVNKVKDENPGLAHADAVRKAKETYVKTPKKKRDTTGYKPNPWMEHIKAFMNANPEWRKEYSYKDLLKKAKETYR